MNKIIAVPAQQIVNVENTSYTSSKSQREAQRLRDLFILLTDLIAREKATIELIIDCLYDIGYVNWLDRKVPVRSVNWLAKLVARTSKPVIRLVAWRWFNRNCPQLITKWLYAKVKF
jgi:hypothetical protein